MKRLFACLFLVCRRLRGRPGKPRCPGQAGSPTKFSEIVRKDGTFRTAMHAEGHRTGRSAKVLPISTSNTTAWPSASKGARPRPAAATPDPEFKTLLVRTYSNARSPATGIRSDQWPKPFPCRPGATDVRCRTHPARNKPVQLDYNLERARPAGGSMVVAGISLVTNYRDQFARRYATAASTASPRWRARTNPFRGTAKADEK